MYANLSKEFNQCHQVPMNILVHLVTTAGFYVSIQALLGEWSTIFTIGYSMILMATVPWKAALISVALLTVYDLLSVQLLTNQAIALFVVSYLTQDLGHYLASEPTYQSVYTPKTYELSKWIGFVQTLTLHTFYMLPLVIDSAIQIELISELMSWFLIRDRIIKIKLDSTSDLKNLKICTDWLDSQKLPTEVTSHWWYCSLPDDVKQAFHDLATSQSVMTKFEEFFTKPEYSVSVVDDLNEVYVATADSSKASSDNVFYSNHVDGPYLLYPFCSVYRAIIALNPNDFIKTIFTANPDEKVLTEGDMWAFDYNREVHRIEQVKESASFRYSLKVHYVIYPTSLRWYGQVLASLTVLYNTLARLAFLKTLKPKSTLESLLWRFIMFCTHLFYTSVRTAGNSGALSFVAALMVICSVLPVDLPVFLISTSFVHYFIYISTYYHYQTYRGKIAFEAFKSTVMFYKAIAFYHLILNYVQTMNGVDYISLAMIAAGFGLSGSAAAAIGIDHTYFGVELGVVKGERVTSFPYNLVSHPMIMGNIIGLLGFMKQDGFKERLPWLVPVHIFLYTVHMLQEHFDIKKEVKAVKMKAQ